MKSTLNLDSSTFLSILTWARQQTVTTEIHYDQMYHKLFLVFKVGEGITGELRNPMGYFTLQGQFEFYRSF